MTNPYLVAAIGLAMASLFILVVAGFFHAITFARHAWQRLALYALGMILLWLLMGSLLDFAKAQS